MTRGNPLFPYVYRFGMPIFDRLFYRRYRREAMSNATGRLLMVGVGPGTDLMLLPPAVTSVVAVEPEAAMRRMASALARRHGIAVDVVDGIGESIPFPDNSFNSVHVGLVLCSVDDVAATLGEIRRVLAPGGRLGVLEHVRGDGPGPDRKAVVLAGFRLPAQPPNHRLHCRGRIRYRRTAPHPTNPGAAPVYTSSARIRHCGRGRCLNVADPAVRNRYH